MLQARPQRPEGFLMYTSIGGFVSSNDSRWVLRGAFQVSSQGDWLLGLAQDAERKHTAYSIFST